MLNTKLHYIMFCISSIHIVLILIHHHLVSLAAFQVTDIQENVPNLPSLFIKMYIIFVVTG